jgi:manganese/iron transport system permease protein
VNWLTEPFQFEFMQTALLAAVLVGVTNATIGVHVVRRRMAFIGDALAHTTLPGLVIASMWGASLSLGALAAGVATAFAIHLVGRKRAIAEDTAIGVVFTGLFAFGVLLASQTKSMRNLTDVLFGNLFAVSRADLAFIAGVTAFVLMLLAALHKELELTAFDPTHSEAIGLKPDRVRLLLLLLLALTVVTSIQAVGVVLTSALLVTPAATASLLSQRLAWVMVLSASLAALAALVGLLVSYYLQASVGAAMVLVCTAFFGVVSLGQVVAQWWRPPSAGEAT